MLCAEDKHFKVIALLRKKTGLSRAEFAAHYAQHAPLITQLLPGIHADALDTAAAFDLDVVTAIYLQDRSSDEVAMAIAARPDAAQRMADDEAQFLDRSGSRMLAEQHHGSVRHGKHQKIDSDLP